ncbi:type VI secretion system ATPase TssH [Alteromonas sp. ASW11-130]|uniref:type VI secretion system ATPase TssH n=1 Tax=Alteromonas sp. ASW11-130 TaxID=3015775 RepID=UPI0022426F76|nr:type VI secretion system ATPase TssH [Alteromonas sp. ASW11-130]MCW8092787.1 type VI secretion system ATPase TssH [Alteromonas sp. ASW11-130]
MDKIKLKSFVDRLNTFCTQALEGAAGFAVNNANYEIGVEHFLLKLLEQAGDVAQILAHYDVNILKFIKLLQSAVENEKRGNKQKPVFSKTLIGLLEDAWLIASLEQKVDNVRSGTILLAILANPRRHGLSPYIDELGEISYDELKRKFEEIVSDSTETQTASDTSDNLSKGTVTQSSEASAALEQFCNNFTQQARDGKIDPVFCRDSEIRQMIDILARRRKNNPICVGEAGVGKTSVVEGLALRVVEDDVPSVLKGVEILGLDLNLLQAGASVKGEFEKRLKNVIDGVKQSAKPIILFIDEAHTLIGAGGAAGSGDAANLLKPALARGELRTIAATTWTEYKKYFEKDPALARRFQLVKLDEPTPEQAVTIIRGLSEIYEKTHGVYIRDDAVQAAAMMSARYINGRQLPDKAVDVLDTAAARVKISISSKPDSIDDVERELSTIARALNSINRDISADIKTDDNQVQELEGKQEELKEQQTQLTDRWQKEKAVVERLIALKQSSSDTTEEADDVSSRKSQISELKAELAQLQGDDPLVHYEVTPQVIGEVISNWTGIPVGKMVKNQASAILHFSSELKQRIKGQDHAIEAIDRGLRTAKAGINNPDSPMGVFLLVGPSGVGKTETCIGVADLLFGGERYLTSVNMSEFQEKHSVSRLIGSPPGYVGYGEGGLLTEAIRQKPYSVVLLDEVEKADLEVLNLFYQVFDKGVLSDGEGQLVDFKNTVMFLTSNLATDIITDMYSNSENPPTIEDVTEAIRPTLSAHFKPALLARMQIIPFITLSPDVIANIVRLKLDKVKSRLRDNQKLDMHYSEDVVKTITARCTDVDSGARNVDHIINGSMLPKIATEILEKLSEENEISRLDLKIDEQGNFETQFS